MPNAFLHRFQELTQPICASSAQAGKGTQTATRVKQEAADTDRELSPLSVLPNTKRLKHSFLLRYSERFVMSGKVSAAAQTSTKSAIKAEGADSDLEKRSGGALPRPFSKSQTGTVTMVKAEAADTDVKSSLRSIPCC